MTVEGPVGGRISSDRRMSRGPLDGELFCYRTSNEQVMSKKAAFLLGIVALTLLYFVKK